MKYALMSDYHGANLEKLGVPEFLEDMKVDSIVSMGDFDQTSTIHQYQNLKRNYPTIEVPGNHDYIILMGHGMKSGTLEAQGKTAQDLTRELYEDKDALDYLKQLVTPPQPGVTKNRVRMFLDQPKFGDRYQTMVIHGAYAGDLSSSPDYPAGLKDVWFRLRSGKDYWNNFRVMEKKGYNVMLRGHDHTPAYVFEEAGKLQGEPCEEGKEHRLPANRRHVINPGALFDGRLAIIDTDASKKGFLKRGKEEFPVLTFYKL